MLIKIGQEATKNFDVSINDVRKKQVFILNLFCIKQITKIDLYL